MVRIGIFIGPKGRGSNMQAIARACLSGQISASVEVVISPKIDSPAVEIARGIGLKVEHIDPSDGDYANRLLGALQGCDLVCLAGFLRLLPQEVLSEFPNRILNIHPALLPKFGGKGMYGNHVHEAVLSSGETESGCSVHFVTENYDEGEVILQKKCSVLSNDTVESLSQRVLQLEHLAYPEAIQKVVESI